MQHPRLAALLVLPALWLGCARTPERPARPSVAPPALVSERYTLGATEPEALLVALHYSGSTPSFWKELLQGWDLPTHVVLPQGPLPRREGFTWFPADHEQKAAADKAADVERMAASLAQLIREVRAAHPGIRRVAVTGFSYGGDLAWVLALRYPELVDVAVPMGSRLLGEPVPGAARVGRVRVLQGGSDPIVTAPHTVERVEALKGAGIPIDVQVYPGLGHDLSPQLVADWRAFLQRELAASR